MELDIEKNVLLDIAVTTLQGIEGLELASAPLNVGGVLRAQPGRARRLRSPRALKVSQSEQGVTFDLGLNVEYGRNIVSLAKNAQQSLTENVQLMTGLKVLAVNVTVQALAVQPVRTGGAA